MHAATYHLALPSRPAIERPGLTAPEGRACCRIYTRPRRRASQSVSVSPKPVTSQPETIRLQPITARPLQPFVLRETACSFLECKASGRRCIAADAREVELGYQVAYCLGGRHLSCSKFRLATTGSRINRSRKLVYTALAFIMIALVAAAFVQALGLSASEEIGRAVGLS